MKVVHQNLLLPFGSNMEDSENNESKQDVNGDQIASRQSLMMVRLRLKLCQQILDLRVKVMQSMYSVYKLYEQKYWVNTIWGWVKCPFWHQ